MVTETDAMFASERWFTPGRGPRYAQLSRYMAKAIRAGLLEDGAQIPAERDLAGLAGVSRVTIRKAVAQLAEAGLIEQRRGAGSFVLAHAPKLQQSLSSLISFTQNMQARGQSSTSVVLLAGLYPPAPDELLTLGLGQGDRVARVRRLRSADGMPVAIESSALPEDILPNPGEVTTSLYEVLNRDGRAPTRAIQRVTATSVSGEDARLLNMEPGAAALLIDRTAYLATGRPIEFTRGLYRPDSYDFVSELRADPA